MKKLIFSRTSSQVLLNPMGMNHLNSGGNKFEGLNRFWKKLNSVLKNVKSAD